MSVLQLRKLKLPGTKRAASPRAKGTSLSRGPGGAQIVILAGAQSSRHGKIIHPAILSRLTVVSRIH